MKKLPLFFAILFFASNVFAATEQDYDNAIKLAKAGIIVDRTEKPEMFRLDDTISRAELVGVALTLNEVELPFPYPCKGYYPDARGGVVADWICRAVEIAADNTFVSRENTYFRPLENITRAEAFAVLYDSSGFVTRQGVEDYSFQDEGIVEWQKNLFQQILGSGLEIPGAVFPKQDTSNIRDLFFPVDTGYTPFGDTFGDPRPGGRSHEGIDILAPKMTKLFAVTDGIITFAPTDEPSWGYTLSLKDEDGYTYKYLHVNNDTPGTDDGNGGVEYAYAPGIKRGSKVTRGQHIAYLGDSGNAEWVTDHLHFELHSPTRKVINPYQSLKLAESGITGESVFWNPNQNATRAEIFAFAVEILENQ